VPACSSYLPCIPRRKREFTIERTRNVKNSDGTDSMLTFKIVTDHKECLLIVRASPFEPRQRRPFLSHYTHVPLLQIDCLAN